MTITLPAKMFEPVRVNTSEPSLVRLPLPLMTLLNVTLSALLKTRLALSRTMEVLPIEAPLPPLPICRVPPLTVVLPL